MSDIHGVTPEEVCGTSEAFTKWANDLKAAARVANEQRRTSTTAFFNLCDPRLVAALIADWERAQWAALHWQIEAEGLQDELDDLEGDDEEASSGVEAGV